MCVVVCVHMFEDFQKRKRINKYVKRISLFFFSSYLSVYRRVIRVFDLGVSFCSVVFRLTTGTVRFWPF